MDFEDVTEVMDIPGGETGDEDCLGWGHHTWTLSIEEGSVTLLAKSCGPTCRLWFSAANGETYHHGIGDYMETLEMLPMPVRVQMATECPAYPVDDNNVPTGPPKSMRGYESGSHYIAHGTRCDCNWWAVVSPFTVSPS